MKLLQISLSVLFILCTTVGYSADEQQAANKIYDAEWSKEEAYTSKTDTESGRDYAVSVKDMTLNSLNTYYTANGNNQPYQDALAKYNEGRDLIIEATSDYATQLIHLSEANGDLTLAKGYFEDSEWTAAFFKAIDAWNGFDGFVDLTTGTFGCVNKYYESVNKFGQAQQIINNN